MCASVRIRTCTTLDQDCILKATVFRMYIVHCLKAIVRECTTCIDVSWLTTCMNFNTPPLFMSPLKVGRSLEEGQDEFVVHGCLMGFVCPALTEPEVLHSSSDHRVHSPRAMTSDFRSNRSSMTESLILFLSRKRGWLV